MCSKQLWQWLTTSQFKTNWQCSPSFLSYLFLEDSPWTAGGPGGLTEPGLAREFCRQLERCFMWCHWYSPLGTNQITSGSQSYDQGYSSSWQITYLRQWEPPLTLALWRHNMEILPTIQLLHTAGQNPFNPPVPSGKSIVSNAGFVYWKQVKKYCNRDYVYMLLLVQKSIWLNVRYICVWYIFGCK